MKRDLPLPNPWDQSGTPPAALLSAAVTHYPPPPWFLPTSIMGEDVGLACVLGLSCSVRVLVAPRANRFCLRLREKERYTGVCVMY